MEQQDYCEPHIPFVELESWDVAWALQHSLTHTFGSDLVAHRAYGSLGGGPKFFFQQQLTQKQQARLLGCVAGWLQALDRVAAGEVRPLTPTVRMLKKFVG